MKLSIRSVSGHGNLEKERIVLKAQDDIDIGDYMLADTTYVDEDEISNKLRHTFWIPEKEVSKGDLIVIYTKEGRDRAKRNDSGSRTHFFYWGLGKTIWNKNEDAAAVFHIKDWVSKQV